MGFVFLFVFVAVLAAMLLRGRRKNTLAGLNAARPQHVRMVEHDPGSGGLPLRRGDGNV